MLQASGKKHLTKKEIEARKATEIKLGSDTIVCPDTVANDLNAYKKWQQITKEYEEAKANGNDIFKSSDIGILERYCLNYSFWLEELGKIRKARKMENKKELRISMMALQKEMRADEDRLLLNIISKIKNVPKQEMRKPDDPMQEAGFNL